ncbi:MAG: DUF5615 family PIN-like protein [Propionibacteriaceae bacterium]|jgi:predicted nuclease of predicted toxin-antitoxin system|nr:DUF5615 family PIN-like protein [Propionibacteriaceae bacterium]
MAELAFLLDEHYPAALAASLTQLGIDTQSVNERDDLRGTSDINVLTVAAREGRVVVTEDASTFPTAMTVVGDYPGVVFCDSGRFPRTVNALPRLEKALVAFATHPPATTGFVWWLKEAV